MVTFFLRIKKIFLILGLCVSFSNSLFALEKPRKNVLLIMADDFNYWNKLQGYYPLAKTPNLDKMSSKGVLFVDAQAAAPVCNPSRNAFWSGLRPLTTGIEGNADGSIRTTAPFEKVVTMNQYFLNHGYWVYGAGKLYHHGISSEDVEADFSNWNAHYQGSGGCSGGSYLNFTSSEPEYTWSVNPNPMSRNNCGDHDMAQAVASILTNYSKSSNKDKPFFMAIGFVRPHLPFNVPKEFYELFKDSDIVIPKGFKEGDLSDTKDGPDAAYTDLIKKGKWKEIIHMYLAALALTDHNAGVVFDALNNTEYKENTIVVFVGDHGWHLGEKERFGKATPWDLANRTTMIIYDPSHKNSSTTPKLCKKVVSMQDVYPTLIELAGLPLKTDIEGNSLAPLIENPDHTVWDKPVLVSRVFDRLRTNQWSYVRDRTNSAKNMLYDIENDPFEFDNLLFKDQKVLPATQVQAIKAMLDKKLDSLVNIGQNIKKKIADKYVFTPKILQIPGKIEAEDYDEGGYLQTHYDAKDTVNIGGKYRTADAIDIYTSDDLSGVFQVQGLSEGDWMNYSVSDYIPGIYNISFRVKNPNSLPGTLQILNRDSLLGELVIPASVNNWITLQLPKISLPKQNSVRIQIKVKSGKEIQFNYTEWELMINTHVNFRANIKRKTLQNKVADKGILFLDLTSTDIWPNLSVYNNFGQLLFSENVPGEQKIAYHMKSKLKPGVYFLKISDDQVSSIEYFLVK